MVSLREVVVADSEVVVVDSEVDEEGGLEEVEGGGDSEVVEEAEGHNYILNLIMIITIIL